MARRVPQTRHCAKILEPSHGHKLGVSDLGVSLRGALYLSLTEVPTHGLSRTAGSLLEGLSKIDECPIKDWKCASLGLELSWPLALKNANLIFVGMTTGHLMLGDIWNPQALSPSMAVV